LRRGLAVSERASAVCERGAAVCELGSVVCEEARPFEKRLGRFERARQFVTVLGKVKTLCVRSRSDKDIHSDPFSQRFPAVRVLAPIVI
jgi:hypothetical protein